MCNKVNILFCQHKNSSGKETYRNVVSVVECDDSKMRCIIKAASLNVLSTLINIDYKELKTEDKIWDKEMTWTVVLNDMSSYHLFYETYFLNSL